MIGVREQQDLLLAIARKLERPLTVYAVGGTAMMFHGLKDTTKDMDIVFTTEADRQVFKKAAQSLGYTPYDSTILYGGKGNHPIMLSRGEERFDLFLETVINFSFSENMQERAKNVFAFDRTLTLHIADQHDIIMMKCATERAKDLEDVKDILEKNQIDWDIIIEEAKLQVKKGHGRAIYDLTAFVSDLQKAGVKLSGKVKPRLFELLENQVPETKEDQAKLGKFTKNNE